MMMFSIVIPLHNCTSYLTETISSLAHQIFSDFEVIAIDDHSDDQSFELAHALITKFNLKGYAIRKPPHQGRGVSSTRNLGVKLAKGDWICFLDSDDLFHVEKLNVLQKSIRTTAHLFFHHSVYKFTEGDLPNLRNQLEEVELVNSDNLYDQNNIVTSSVCVKRDLLEKAGGFNENLNGVEDYQLWLKLSIITQLVFIPQKLGFYQVRKISLMGNRKFDYYVKQSMLLSKNIEFLPLEKRRKVMSGIEYDLSTLYSNTSIRGYGYFSLFPGLINMMGNGYFSLAFRILFVKSKNLLLAKLFTS